MREGKGVEVDYEGMGTCIEATITVDGKYVTTICAFNAEGNDATRIAVDGAMKALKAKYEGPTMEQRVAELKKKSRRK